MMSSSINEKSSEGVSDKKQRAGIFCTSVLPVGQVEHSDIVEL